jgi:non-ribosomal peptide synthetase component E (peptide arylation enzyme)
MSGVTETPPDAAVGMEDKIENADLLLDRLRVNAVKDPNKLAASFLGPGRLGGNIERQLTYQELETETTDLAMRILADGMKKGDRCVDA